MTDRTSPLVDARAILDDVDAPEPFSLAELERDHLTSEHPLGLADCFGDGVLLARSPILDRLRRALLGHGYRFVRDDDFSGDYDMTPFLQLEAILAHKTIPYRPTARAVRRILERAPSMRLDHFAVRNVFARNCPHHESAHALFYEIAKGHEGELAGERLVDVLIASEAITVAVESFVALLSRRRSTALFLAMNADADPYLFASAERSAPGVLAAASELADHDPAAFFRFLAGAFLIANLRPAAVVAKPALSDWLASHAGIPTHLHTAARQLLGGLGFVVCVTFRTQLVPAFFRYLELEEAYLAASARPLAEAFASGSPFAEYLAPFVDALDLPAASRLASVAS